MAKIRVYRTTGPILTKLGTNHPWGRGFKLIQMKGIAPLQREIIAKSVKVHFSRTSRSNSIKLGTNYECKFVQMKGQVLFKGEIITKT
jgi:hypothetical protein